MPSGSVTRANMKISAIDGTAFVDFSAADVLTNYLGGKLTITDSAGKKITGYIKAAGTGETLDTAANVSNCVNSPTAPYDSFSGASSSGFSAVNSTLGTKRAGTADEIVVAIGELWKLSCSITVNSGTCPYWQFRNTFGGSYLGAADISPNLSAGANSTYQTTIVNKTGVIEILSTADVDFTISSMAAQKVLTPSATGVTIVSESGGTTYNWASKDADFNYYDRSGYTYEIEDVISRRGMSFRVGTRL